MKSRRLYSICIVLLIAPQAATALSPPSESGWSLCNVTGTVERIIKEEAADEAMRPVQVDVAVIDIRESSPAGEAKAGGCVLPSADAAGKHLGYYRICDSVSPEAGAHIEAVAGASRGGGRFCIERIKILTQP